jgi:RecA-family ATPase
MRFKNKQNKNTKKKIILVIHRQGNEKQGPRTTIIGTTKKIDTKRLPTMKQGESDRGKEKEKPNNSAEEKRKRQILVSLNCNKPEKETPSTIYCEK